MFAGPVDVFVFADLEEQIELLCKKRVVVLQLQAEQWKRVDERTSADDHLGPALRKKIERSKILKHPYRVS